MGNLVFKKCYWPVFRRCTKMQKDEAGIYMLLLVHWHERVDHNYSNADFLHWKNFRCTRVKLRRYFFKKHHVVLKKFITYFQF